MDPQLQYLLAQPHDMHTLPALIREYAINLDTLQALKDRSAAFYFSEPAEALRIAQLAHQLSVQMPPPATALGQWTLANALLHNSQLTAAKTLFEQARQAYLALGDRLAAARMGIGHVAILAYTGQLQAGLALANEIKPILEAAATTNLADERRLGNLLMNMGILYDVQGQYEESLVIYAQQMAIATRLQDEIMIAQSCHNQGYALMQVGALTEALAQYTQAEALFIRHQATADLLRLYINLGSVLALLNRYLEARAVQEKAEQLLVDGAEMAQLQHRLSLLRTLFHLQGHTPVDDALIQPLEQARRAFAQHGPLVEEGLALILLGRCHLQRGDLVAARQNFEEAHTLVQQQEDRALAYRVLHGLARVAHAEQNFPTAIAQYTDAIQQLESIRHELQIESYRAAFLTDKLQVYQDLAALHLQQAHLDLAFAVVERAKSRLVTEKLAARLTAEVDRAAHSADPQVQTLAQQLNALLTQLDQIYQQRENEHKQQNSSPLGALNFDTSATVPQIEQAVQELLNQLQHRQQLFSLLTTGYTAPLPQIQANLQHALLLQYHLLDDHFAVFVVDRDQIKRHLRLAPVAAVEEARQALTTAIERMLSLTLQWGPTRVGKFLPQLRDDANRQLNRLYQLLLEPLQAFLPAGAPLVISPEHTLYYIPFHALYDGQQYVIEQRAVSYAPSATLLDACTRAQPSGQGALLCGYADEQLTAISAELQAIAQFFPQAHWLVQEAATTSAFLTYAQQCRLLHLAAHATFRTDQPMLSSIVLADRRLTLAEITRQPLHADLVVLSGCETGHGQLRGADLVSLATGFLGAGARSLLVSLWRVEDQATAQLMVHFYQALFAGQDRAQALRTAQVALLRHGRAAQDHAQLFTHPAYWAPFTLVGHWQSALV
ncbi:MAG: CHAT domain-containing protein [Caldilineaceae bacterium]|nr:CHAT domain-containing protein [Caldilineaceae bacterium]